MERFGGRERERYEEKEEEEEEEGRRGREESVELFLRRRCTSFRSRIRRSVAAAFRNRIAICGDNATSFEPFWRRKRRKTNTEKNGRIGEKRASEEERSKKN